MNAVEERKIIMDRFFYRDRDFHAIGKACEISWFNKFNEKFAKDRFAYFSSEEKIEAMNHIADNRVSDQEFVSALNLVKGEKNPILYDNIDRFVGEHYYFDTDVGFLIDNQQSSVKEDVIQALKELGVRGFRFLQAVVNLYERGKWDRAYGGVTWADILAEIRRLGGGYPSPRDIAILKSFKLYYKTGSRRYPTHTIPEEILEVVKSTLKKWKSYGTHSAR